LIWTKVANTWVGMDKISYSGYSSANVVARIGAPPSASPKPFVVSERIPILKITFGSVGCSFGATTESTSIFPPSFYSSLRYKPYSDANLE
jgi:hypothetical protein